MELYTGLSQKIYLNVYTEQDTDKVESDYNPTVVIYNADTDELVTVGTSQPVDDDPGAYQFLLLDDFLQTDYDIKVVWTYAVEGNEQQSIDFYHIVTPYISMIEAYRRLGYSRSIYDKNYKSFAEMMEAERFARFMIETYTGVRFGKFEKTITAYGQDADVLFLNDRIIEFKSLRENNQLVVDIEEGINTFGFPVEITETNYSIRIFSDDDINEGGKKDVVYPLKGTFYNGYRYDVSGVFGWTHMPQKIQTAAVMLMKDFFGKDHAWRTRYVQDVSFGDTDMKFSKLAFRGTGNFYVDKLLDHYKTPNIAVI